MRWFKLIFFVLASGPLFGKVIIVNQSGTIASVKAAVDMAADGDTIVVKPGLYREGNIVVEKSVCILGESYPTMDGEGKYEIFTIHGNDVVIQGLRFMKTGVASIDDLAAIKILDSRSVRVTNNRFDDTFFGIHVSNSSNSWIEHNVLTADAKAEYQAGNGIHLWKCHHITVSDNSVTGHRDGIYLEFVTNTLVTGNRSEGNLRYGLHFMFSHNNEYRNNAFIRNGAGVAVMYTTGVRMIDNTFELNWGSSSYGLLLKDIRDSEVTNNRFSRNSVAIFMEGSSRIQFVRNEFSQNGYAVRLQASCDGNKFTANNFSGNTFDVATNGTLSLNKVNGNYWDKYTGYDLNDDSVGDVPFHPVSMYSMVVEQMPVAVLLWRSFLVMLMDKAEKAIPAVTPENLKDETPSMKPYDIN